MRRRNNPDGISDDEREKRQQEDIYALEGGGLPFSAQERLREIAEAEHPVFSSDLTTREFLVLSNSKVRPLAQVMGTAFMRIPKDAASLKAAISGSGSGSSSSSFGYSDRSSRIYSSIANTYSQSYSQSYNQSYSQPFTGELYDLSEARLQVRQMAISRMEQEATILGASGIVGVRVVKKVHDWFGRTVEFTILGTAVHVPGYDGDRPFTSLLSGQEFWQLWEAGWQPKGIALGVCSYTDCTDWSAINQRSYNQEVITYTDCFYQAREIAMQYFIKNMRQLRASGAVGMDVEYEFEEGESEYEVSEGVEVKYLHLLTHFIVMGTAIGRRQMPPTHQPPRRVLIYDLRKAGAASVTFSDSKKNQEKKSKGKSEKPKPEVDDGAD